MTRTARPLGAAVACLALVGACRARKASEIDRAPRANPTIPAGKPALAPDGPAPPDTTARPDSAPPPDTTPRKP